MTPWWRSQRTIGQLRWPARLSQIRRSRSGGNGSRGSWPSQVAHRASGGRSSSGAAIVGSVARTAISSPCSQGWSTALVAFVTPLARSSPVAGRNSVSSLAVPPRTYSCGSRTGSPTGAQLAPAWGIAWYGPASSWHQSGTPAASASRYARSMAPFFFRPRVDHPDHTGLALALRRAGRTPRPRPLVRAARVVQRAPNRRRAHTRQPLASERSLQRRERPGRRPIDLPIRWPLRRRHDPAAGHRVVGRPPTPPGRDLQRPKPDLIEAPHEVRDRARTPKPRRPGCCRKRLPPSHRQHGRRSLHPVHALAARLRDPLQLTLLRHRQRPQALLPHGCHDPPLLPYSLPLATHFQRNAA